MKICKECGQELPEEAKTIVVDNVEYDTNPPNEMPANCHRLTWRSWWS